MSYSSQIGFFVIGESPIGSLTGSGGQYALITSTGTYGFSPDWQQSPFGMSYAIEVPGGVTTSFSLSYTLDDVNDLSWSPVLIADPTHGGSTVVTAFGHYSFPIRSLLVDVAALSGGSIRFAVLQGSRAR